MVIDFVFAFIALVIVVLALVILWALISLRPRKIKLESKVRRSRRNLNLILDEEEGGIFQVVKKRKLGEFRWLFELKGGSGGHTIRKSVWEWQLRPLNALVAVAGDIPATWVLSKNTHSTYDELRKKYQEMTDEKLKQEGLVAISKAEERELAREMIEQVTNVVGKAGKKDDSK